MLIQHGEELSSIIKYTHLFPCTQHRTSTRVQIDLTLSLKPEFAAFLLQWIYFQKKLVIVSDCLFEIKYIGEFSKIWILFKRGEWWDFQNNQLWKILSWSQSTSFRDNILLLSFLHITCSPSLSFYSDSLRYFITTTWCFCFK